MKQQYKQTDLLIILQSSGYKSGPLPEKGVDLFIDCRSVANPCYIEQFGGAGGTQQNVRDWVRDNTDIEAHMRIVCEALSRIPIRRNDKEFPYEKPFVIHCFCAHGIHRSVSMKFIIGAALTIKGWRVEIK